MHVLNWVTHFVKVACTLRVQVNSVDLLLATWGLGIFSHVILPQSFLTWIPKEKNRCLTWLPYFRFSHVKVCLTARDSATSLNQSDPHPKLHGQCWTLKDEQNRQLWQKYYILWLEQKTRKIVCSYVYMQFNNPLIIWLMADRSSWMIGFISIQWSRS